jgi:hypothetical protein
MAQEETAQQLDNVLFDSSFYFARNDVFQNVRGQVLQNTSGLGQQPVFSYRIERSCAPIDFRAPVFLSKTLAHSIAVGHKTARESIQNTQTAG